MYVKFSGSNSGHCILCMFFLFLFFFLNIFFLVLVWVETSTTVNKIKLSSFEVSDYAKCYVCPLQARQYIYSINTHERSQDQRLAT